MQLIILIAR